MKVQIYDNIDYFLIQNSLLGCIKYNGWIPWECKMDVMIKSTDMEKIRNIIINNNLLKKKLWFQDKTTDKKYKLSWAKLRDVDAFYIPHNQGM